MSKGAEVGDDGFRFVKSKRSSKRKPFSKLSGSWPEDGEINVETARQKILCAQEDLQQSEYLRNFFDAVSSSLGARHAVEIVSFGLGHIAECTISRYQLALLLCLKNHLGVEVLVHDPVFYVKECELLHKLNIKVIAQNEEGKYKISKEGLTVVYLPHCPKQLANNFLWCNWGEQLKHCLLICNSFTRLIDNNPDRVVSNAVPFIFKVFPFTKEISLKNNFKFTDIFNDTSLHIFDESKLKDAPIDFWLKGESPKYEDTTEYITALIVDKLNL